MLKADYSLALADKRKLYIYIKKKYHNFSSARFKLCFLDICLTSGHDGADVLQREHRQLLLRVDPDHAVTQTLHGQDAATRRGGALLQRPAGGRTQHLSEISVCKK